MGRVQVCSDCVVWLLCDLGWFFGCSGVKWEIIFFNGVGKLEMIVVDSYYGGNLDVVNDLIRVIKEDWQLVSSVYDVWVVMEMIVVVFELYRVGGLVLLLLKNCRNLFGML